MIVEPIDGATHFLPLSHPLFFHIIVLSVSFPFLVSFLALYLCFHFSVLSYFLAFYVLFVSFPLLPSPFSTPFLHFSFPSPSPTFPSPFPFILLPGQSMRTAQHMAHPLCER